MKAVHNGAAEGFTLIELLIVIAIIGILAVALVPTLIDVRGHAYDTATWACARSIQTSEAVHHSDFGTYDRLSKSSQAAIMAANTGGVFDVSSLAAACRRPEMSLTSSASVDLATTYDIVIANQRGPLTLHVTPTALVKN